jgi:hypothetical protein
MGGRVDARSWTTKGLEERQIAGEDQKEGFTGATRFERSAFIC